MHQWNKYIVQILHKDDLFFKDNFVALCTEEPGNVSIDHLDL